MDEEYMLSKNGFVLINKMGYDNLHHTIGDHFRYFFGDYKVFRERSIYPSQINILLSKKITFFDKEYVLLMTTGMSNIHNNQCYRCNSNCLSRQELHNFELVILYPYTDELDKIIKTDDFPSLPLNLLRFGATRTFFSRKIDIGDRYIYTNYNNMFSDGSYDFSGIYYFKPKLLPPDSLQITYRSRTIGLLGIQFLHPDEIELKKYIYLNKQIKDEDKISTFEKLFKDVNEEFNLDRTNVLTDEYREKLKNYKDDKDG